MDHDIENSSATLATSSLLLGHKFLEPLNSRRTEHERIRKQIKQDWNRELKRMHEAVNNLRKAKALYMQRQGDYERCKTAIRVLENSNEPVDTSKLEKKKRLEDEAGIRAIEAETNYKVCVQEANERAHLLEQVKKVCYTFILLFLRSLFVVRIFLPLYHNIISSLCVGSTCVTLQVHHFFNGGMSLEKYHLMVSESRSGAKNSTYNYDQN